MPLYEYECDACGNRFEQIQKFSDRPVEKCPECGARRVRKLISSPAIQFKGSGWYVTDYARKEQPAAKAEAGDGDAATKAGGESTDQKTDRKEASRESQSGKAAGPPTQSRPDRDSKAPKESKKTGPSKSATTKEK
jgi:putative FmdB family regulatory protein